MPLLTLQELTKNSKKPLAGPDWGCCRNVGAGNWTDWTFKPGEWNDCGRKDEHWRQLLRKVEDMGKNMTGLIIIFALGGVFLLLIMELMRRDMTCLA